MGIVVQFGAGNVGRGHIGHIFSRAGYKVIFADIDEKLISSLRKSGYYIVRLVGSSIREEIVNNFEIYHLERDRDILLDYLSQADIISTAVGPNIYLSLAPIITEGIKRHSPTPFNVIACENFYRSTERLKEEIFRHLDFIPQSVGFPNVEIGRIVPSSKKGELIVEVEDYDEFLIEKSAFAGPSLNIKGIEFVDNFDLFWKRKIYTLNMGHAILGYLGYLKGYTNVSQAIKDEWIRGILLGAFNEVKELLIELGLESKYIDRYLEILLERFANENLNDTVYRVGRDPIRKLSPEDRLVGPASECEKNGLPYENLTIGIAGALLFNYPEDKSALELQNRIKRDGVDVVLNEICKISSESNLGIKIKENYNTLKRLFNR